MPHQESVRAAPPGPHDLARDEAGVESLRARAGRERLQIRSNDGTRPEALPQPSHATLDQEARPVVVVGVPGPHRVDVEHRAVDIDVLDPRLQVLAEPARVSVAVGGEPEHVDPERDRDGFVHGPKELDQEGWTLGLILARIARELGAVVDREAHVVELHLVEAKGLRLARELHDHPVVLPVVWVEPGATGAPGDPRLVAPDVHDRALGVPGRHLRVRETHDPGDGVHPPRP